MLIAFAVLTIVLAALIYPGWRWIAGRTFGVTLHLLPLAYVIFWTALSVAHVGEQSMGNLIEVPIIAAASLPLAYAAFVTGRAQPRLQLYTSPGAFFVLLASAVALRLLMPVIPECRSTARKRGLVSMCL